MLLIILQTVGGLGLFLLGMIIMTEGLRELAGNVVRAALMRFTNTPLSGAATGAVSTAILQSSSATTVAAIGFVGAGLLSFPAALGIIFGANVGTTITGWLVALLGFKLKIGSLVMPLIFIGATLRLFTKGRLYSIGYAIAGFGLIFVGINEMQQGMEGLQGTITPADFPNDTLIGRLQLVSIGILVTIVTQSSSAGVATTLTALYAGAINFEQAAALVIGMDIGTTVTALMATLGGTVDARRTGYSHVIYNLFTGAGALMLITPYVWCWQSLAPGEVYNNAEIALVAFHTLFNTLGVIVALPFTRRFAGFIENLVLETKPVYTQRLDEALLDNPELALNAVQETLRQEFILLLQHVFAIISMEKQGARTDLVELQLALDQTHAYVDCIPLESSEGANWERFLAVSHALDHMQRLHERCEEDEDRAITARENLELKQHNEKLIVAIGNVLEEIDRNNWVNGLHITDENTARMSGEAEPLREKFVEQLARDEINVPQVTDCLEAVRWLRRVSDHIARIMHHYVQALFASGK